ncbi:hypothetical protein C8R48DRAFT_776739 [Suillus tomentosus]|nr:hypothetical protein C8R48DRAFT_776739 [Suillus tomentosus]
MATLIASFSQPAQILALDEPYDGNARKRTKWRRQQHLSISFNSKYNEFVKEEIVFTMPDGSERKKQVPSMDVANEVLKSLPERIVIAKVDGDIRNFVQIIRL